MPARSPTFLIGGRLLAANPPAVMWQPGYLSKLHSNRDQLSVSKSGFSDANSGRTFQ